MYIKKKNLSKSTDFKTGPFREVGRFRELPNIVVMVLYLQWVIVLGQNKAIDITEWSICGGGRLERF